MSASMAAALEAAGINDLSLNSAETPKKTNKRKWNTATAEQRSMVQWNNSSVGTVSFSVKGFRLGEVQSVNGCYWAKILVGNERPSSITVDIATNLADGFIPVYAKGSNVVDGASGIIPSLTVPVKWREEKGIHIPHTRVKDMDNADLYLVNDRGQFIDHQVAVLTRHGNFYLSAQELSTGQIVKVPDGATKESIGFTTVVNDKGTFTVIPVDDEYAYPGADFLMNVAPRGGPKFIEIAMEDGTCPETDNVQAPEWTEIVYPSDSRWGIGGIVMYFNPIVGGKALCSNGEECYIPLQVIENDEHRKEMDDGGFPILVPLQQVLLMRTKTDQGYKALKLKSIPMS